MKKKKIIIPLALILILLLWGISWLPVTERISINLKAGEDIRIALITDLHSCYYGPGQKWLLNRIDKEGPDIVMLGGDIFDDRLKDDNAKALIEGLVKRYPCYYVSGNHEYWSGRVEEMKEWLRSSGVNVLEGSCETVTIKGTAVDICGVDDPTELLRSTWEKQLDTAYAESGQGRIKILLSHRPEEAAAYEHYDFDLILAGHAHAGQFRIPFINRGLYAPNQGFMAEYVSGMYKLKNGSSMVVSRGLARESIPLPRFFNHPELVMIELN
ncbi:MAG: metallophosphoesterase [Lachnospiraceae bacterium]|nr:metallophosphoesterase [Lachnospiraceae bacterium]